MVTLLRLVSLLILVAGVIGAIELLPPTGGARSLIGTVLGCVIGGSENADQGGATACSGFLPSLYGLLGGFLAALLIGALASLLYNAKKTREIMERFEDVGGPSG